MTTKRLVWYNYSMKTTSTYKTKILYYNEIFSQTLSVYNEAVSYLIDVVYQNRADIFALNGKKQNNYLERLCIKTKKNPDPPYDFSKRFYKFPSYYRRAAMQFALGHVQSYLTKLYAWTKSGNHKNKPGLQAKHRAFPVLYNAQSFKRVDDYTVQIKILHQNDWVWLNVNLKPRDVSYIKRHCTQKASKAPTLVKKGKCWYLHTPYAEQIVLSNNKSIPSKIAAVDLGINNSAVCSIMHADGTVSGRKFINQPEEKDRLSHLLGQIKKSQTKGAVRNKRLWALANNKNREIAVRTASAIVEFAVKNKAEVIVLEHLDMHGKKKGSNKQRLQLWRNKEVVSRVTHKAHQAGIRVSTINARNSSKLAFDGSGKVKRDSANASICVFSSGKQYNCDLSASYNIGARYFVRETIKSLPETVELAVLAKVPELAKRTTCTLSSLISLNAELNALLLPDSEFCALRTTANSLPKAGEAPSKLLA